MIKLNVNAKRRQQIKILLASIFTLSTTLLAQDIFDGYTLFCPLTDGPITGGGENYSRIMDNDGNIINQWDHDRCAATAPYLMPDSTLICPFKIENPYIAGSAYGGKIIRGRLGQVENREENPRLLRWINCSQRRQGFFQFMRCGQGGGTRPHRSPKHGRHPLHAAERIGHLLHDGITSRLDAHVFRTTRECACIPHARIRRGSRGQGVA